MNDARLLLVEDDEPLAQLMADALRRGGLQVDLAHRGDGVVERIHRDQPDLVVLDVMLPGMDGFEILRALRPGWAGPVLMLTARGDAFDQVAGLELGADDYVAKPVIPQVLLARVRALLRRARPNDPASAVQTFGDLQIVPSAREARGRKGVIPLSDAEYDLLAYLASRAGEVVERDELFRALRGIPYDGLDRSIDLRVSKLRAQLRDHLDGRSPIRTVHGRGYLFAVAPR